MANRPPPSLRDLMQTLPQELYDEIFDMTFTADTSIRKLNTATKKRVLGKFSSGSTGWRDLYLYSNVAAVFPAVLHVNRSTRAQFAKSYYGQGAFIAVHEWEAARRWAEILPADHRSLLKGVSIVAKKPSEVKNAVRARRMCVQFAQDFGEHMNFEIGGVESVATKLGVPVEKLVDTLGL